MTTVLLSASEPSGDALGAALMEALQARRPSIQFVGGGGPLMKQAGLQNPLPTDKLAVMGPADALAALPRAMGLAGQLGALAAEHKPAATVLIDSWTFSKMAASKIKAQAPHTKMVKLGVPQVWASRPDRAAVAAELFDLLLCLLPFEPEHFEAVGGQAQFVGNPNFQAISVTPRSGPSFRAKHGIDGAPLLLMLPGSRAGEVKRLLPVFEQALGQLRNKAPGLKVAVVAAGAVEDRVRSSVQSWPGDIIIVSPEDRFNAFDAGDVALAASGTVTTELALTGTPMVVTYRVGPLVARWAKRVLITPYVTILNVAAGDMIIPERLQEACEPTQLAADVARLLTDEEARRRQTSAFRRLLPSLVGSMDAADAAAEAVLGLIDHEQRRDLNGGAAGE